MAQKESEAGPSKQNEDLLEEALGFASKDFDPLRVIYASSLDQDNENVEIFNSVSQFMENVQVEPLQTPSSSLSLEHNRTSSDADASRGEKGHHASQTNTGSDLIHSASDSDTSSNHGGNEQLDSTATVIVDATSSDMTQDTAVKPWVPLTERLETLTSRKKRERRTIITEMKTGFNYGPLNILKRSVEEKIKVRVWTRTVRNVRGICTGYVVAFDKHMNLALMDVDEIYRKPLGKHQKKSRKHTAEELPQQEKEKVEEEQTEDVCYPNTPWQPVDYQAMGITTTTRDTCSHLSCETVPADGIGDLSSAFRGMQMFEETETTRLLGTKSRRLLKRHLNQVLLRGDHVVAIALVEPAV